MLTNRYRSFVNTKVIETGSSDFHKMMVTVLKTYFKKEPPKMISYRDFKRFSNDIELEVMLNFYDIHNLRYDKFDEIFMTLTNKQAPLKYKYIRANHGPFMNKELRKSIMTRSRLKHHYSRVKTEES